MGSARNMSGAQEKAKDLVSEAQRLFETLNLREKEAEAQSQLGVCYWRLGAFDDARVILDEATKTVGDDNDELKARILIRRALIETWACRYYDAVYVLKQAEEFFKKLSDPLKGRWHGQMGSVLQKLGVADNRKDLLDRSIIEYTAAIYHYEQSHNERYVAINVNNLAMLLYRVGRYQDAHENLDRAVSIFERLKDAGTLAQVNETRARVLLAEQKFDEAKTVIERAAADFEVGGEQSCLADALTIQATVFARLGDNANSLSVFQRAIDIAANAGALENAGHASLSMIEEHGTGRLSELDVFAAYQRADEFLRGTQDAEDISRLRACAKIVMRRLMGTQISDSDFALKRAMRNYEARFIEAALSRSGGKISQAATMLGLSHQTLSNILKYRQKTLLDKRLPPTPRRKSIVRQSADSRHSKPSSKAVLYVEDDKTLANAVKKMLERDGFTVDISKDGVTGLANLKRDKKYDVLIFDNEQQGINGIGLARQAREIQHRRRTPIIVFSSDDVATDAYRAGVNLFLQKPDEVRKLTANIKQLLSD
jgi:CheY-like chemotaxis protein/tetratricopeptide (TPR) repeat protein